MAPLLVAILKMLVRDRQALFWALAFPLVFVVVFSLFDVGGPGSATMAVVDLADTQLSQTLQKQLADIEFFDLDNSYASEENAKEALDDGDIDYLLVVHSITTRERADKAPSPLSLTLYTDVANIPTNQVVEGVIAQLLDQLNLQLASAPRILDLAVQGIQLREVRYFDVVLMGLVGMGVMTNSIILIAVKISTYRNQQIFKRLLLTPLSVKRYFASEVSAHLVLALVQAAIIMAVGVFVFGAHIYGNVLYIFLIVALANIVFLNIGFIISGWSSTPAAASGLGNLIALPMMFFSGTFFPTSTLPAFLPELMQVLPLTPMLEALRSVALDDKALWETWPQLAILGGWVAASSAAAIKLFRFS